MVDTIERSAVNRADVIARLQAIEPQLRALLATALYIYGSAARDELSSDSDVDVFIDYDPASEFSFVQLVRLETLVQNALGRPVDFGTRAGLHSALRPSIERSSIQVF